MSMNKTLTAALAAATFATAPVIVAPAMAQQAPAQAEVSETDLEAFVVAYRDVVAIEQAYGQQLQAAADDAEKQAIITEAQVEMTQAVEDAPDIDVDRYIEILQLAQTDPDLQADLKQRLQD